MTPYVEPGGSWRPFWLVAAVARACFWCSTSRCPAADVPPLLWLVAIVAVLGVVGGGTLSARRVWTVRVDATADAALSVGRERVRARRRRRRAPARRPRRRGRGRRRGAGARRRLVGAPRAAPGLPLRLRRRAHRARAHPRPAALAAALLAAAATPPTGLRFAGDTGSVTSLDTCRYAYEAPVSAELFARGQRDHPGGVNSPVRAFRAVGGTPRFMVSGSGPWLTDADGRRYVDLVSSWGPMILGHAHPAVVDAVAAAARRGLSFGAPTEGELDLAEEIRDRMPPVEQVRLVNSGTEAVLSAVRLARGATGRPLVVKFAGCYHGHVDALLASAGSGVATLGLPGHPRRHHRRRRRHRRAALQRRRRGRGGLRRARRRHRLRHHRGRRRQHGRRPAAGRLQRRAAPDHRRARRAADPRRGDDRLPGVPLGLVRPRPGRRRPVHLRQGHGRRAAGRRVRRPRRPDGRSSPRPGRSTRPARCRGTRSRSPPGWPRCGTAPTRSTPAATRSSAVLRGAASAALFAAGVPHRVQQAGNMFSVFFVPDERQVRDYDDARTQDVARYTAFFHAMLARGVYLPPSAFEAWFVNARARRRGARPGARGAARRRPRRGGGRRRRGPVSRRERARRPSSTCSGTARCTTPTRILYGRLPGFRLSDAGEAMARDGRRAGSPTGTSPTWSPARWSGRSRPPQPIAATLDLPVPARRAADRGRQRLRGHAGSAVGDGALRAPGQLVAAAQPVAAVLGRALRRDRRADARRRRGRPRRRPRARGRLRQPPAADLDRCGCTSRAAGTCTTRAAGSAAWPASRRSPTTATGSSASPTPSRPAPPIPTRCPGHEAAARPRAARRAARCWPAARTGARRRRRQQRRRVPVRRRHPGRRGHPGRRARGRPGVLRHAARRRASSPPPSCAGKVAVLNFWGSWCAALPGGDAGVPARSTPRCRDDGVQFLGINVKETTSSSRRPSSTEQGHHLPLALRPARRGGAGVPGLPGQRDPVHDRAGPRGPGRRRVHRRRCAQDDLRTVLDRRAGGGLSVGETFSGLVTDGPLLVAAAVAALVGLISFASPCVLPLVPGYLSYVAGLVGTGARGRRAPRPRGRRGGGDGDRRSRDRRALAARPDGARRAAVRARLHRWSSSRSAPRSAGWAGCCWSTPTCSPGSSASSRSSSAWASSAGCRCCSAPSGSPPGRSPAWPGRRCSASSSAWAGRRAWARRCRRSTRWPSPRPPPAAARCSASPTAWAWASRSCWSRSAPAGRWARRRSCAGTPAR